MGWMSEQSQLQIVNHLNKHISKLTCKLDNHSCCIKANVLTGVTISAVCPTLMRTTTVNDFLEVTWFSIQHHWPKNTT